MILVDTGVWIDYFRDLSSPEARWLRRAMEEDLPISICGLVQMEILQGIKSDRELVLVKSLLDRLPYLRMRKLTFPLAADLYRRSRAKGKIIRNTIDCLIAACAIVHGVPLLQKDKDFTVLAEVSELNLVRI